VIACAFWAGANGGPGVYRYIVPAGSEQYETRDESSAVLLDDTYYRKQLQAVFDYVIRVDSGVGKTTDFYSYDLPSAPSPSTPWLKSRSMQRCVNGIYKRRTNPTNQYTTCHR